MYFHIFLFLIFAACLALLWNSSMWSNALSLINMIFAGIFASNSFEPLGRWLESYMPAFSHHMYFLAFWLLFCLSFLVLRTVTDTISKEKVRFRVPVEITGRIGFAVLCGWLMICLFCMSLHFAPLPQTAFWKGFAKEPKSNCVLGIFAPDRQWLGFMQSRSRGALSTWSSNEFDPDSEFIYIHGQRRADLEENVNRPGGSTLVGEKRK